MGAANACSSLKPPIRVIPVFKVTDSSEKYYSVRTLAQHETSYPFWFQFTPSADKQEGICREFALLFSSLHNVVHGGIGSSSENLYEQLRQHFEGGTKEKPTEGPVPAQPVAAVGMAVSEELEKKLALSLLRGLHVDNVKILKPTHGNGSDVIVELAVPMVVLLTILAVMKSISDPELPTTKALNEVPKLKRLLEAIRLDPSFKEGFVLQVSDDIKGGLPSGEGERAIDSKDPAWKRNIMQHGANFSGLPVTKELFDTYMLKHHKPEPTKTSKRGQKEGGTLNLLSEGSSED